MEAGVESVSSGFTSVRKIPDEVLPPFNNHEKFCILHVSRIQSMFLSVSLTPK